MTGNQINSLVGDLVAMARAMEELPQVQNDLEVERRVNNELHSKIADREASILNLKAELEAAHAATRKAEAERESAETMFLEADERTSRALDFIKATFGNAGSLIQALEPPKPEPTPIVPEAVAVQSTEQVQTRGVIDPFGSPIQSPENVSAGPVSSFVPDASVGQSEPHPTAPSTEAQSAPTASVTEAPATGLIQPMSGETTAKPYEGKWYHEVPGYISLDRWLAGGGDEYRYWNKPSGYATSGF